MLTLTIEAHVALEYALEEYRELREDPIIFIHVHPEFRTAIESGVWIEREFDIGEPRHCIFPRKSVRKSVNDEFMNLEGLEVAVWPPILKMHQLEVLLRSGRVKLIVMRESME